MDSIKYKFCSTELLNIWDFFVIKEIVISFMLINLNYLIHKTFLEAVIEIFRRLDDS